MTDVPVNLPVPERKIHSIDHAIETAKVMEFETIVIFGDTPDGLQLLSHGPGRTLTVAELGWLIRRAEHLLLEKVRR